jgi:hypothetical protein
MIWQHVGFAQRFRLPPRFAPLAVVSSAGLIGAGVCRFAGPVVSDLVVRPIRLGLTAAIACVFTYSAWRDSELPDWIAISLPFAWVVLNPPFALDERSAFARLSLCSLATTLFLQAYPVAGTQLQTSFVWLAPLLCLLIHDLAATSPARSTLARVSTSGIAGLLVVFAGVRAWQSADVYFSKNVSLQLPGAHRVRTPESQAVALECVVLNAAANGKALWTQPGMYSFNVWTGLPAPTLRIATNWEQAFSVRQQNAIAERMAENPELFLIRNQQISAFWKISSFQTPGPLAVFLNTRFRPVAAVETERSDYEFGWVNPTEGRKVVVFGAHWFNRATDEPSICKLVEKRTAANVRWAVVVLPPPAIDLTSVVVRDLETGVALSPTGDPLPVDLGRPLDSAQAFVAPFAADEPISADALFGLFAQDASGGRRRTPFVKVSFAPAPNTASPKGPRSN